MVTAGIGGAMHRRGGACACVNGDRRHGVAGGGEGFCDVGMVRFFSFLNWVVRVFCPTKNFEGNGLLETTVCD